MALYEHIYLVRQDVTAPQVEALTETLKTLIGEHVIEPQYVVL